MQHTNGMSMKSINGMVEDKKWNEISNALENTADVEQIYKDIYLASNQNNISCNAENNCSVYKGTTYKSRNNAEYSDMALNGENRCYFFYDQEGNFYVRFLNQQHQIFFTRKYDAEGKVFELSDKLWETDPVEKIPLEEITKAIDEQISKCKKEIEKMKEEISISKENKKGFEIGD